MICQSLSDDAIQRLRRAHLISNTKGYALVVAEIEFGQVAFEVLLADMVISAINAALEDRKVSLNRVGMRIATHILASAMIDRTVLGKFATDLLSCAALVGHDMSVGMDLSLNNRTQVR